MYGTGYGSISGMIHLVARRPVFAAVVVLAAVSVASVPTTPPPPPAPLPPAVVTYTAADPTPAAADSERAATFTEASKSYSCVFGKATAPTNLCKASLDSIALYLNNNDKATVKVTGSMNHVFAVRDYFTQGEQKFGIAANRIHVNVTSTDNSDNAVSIEQIP